MHNYWIPLLVFAAISTVLQFATFGYCIKVYIRSLFDDGTTNSSSQADSAGLPSYNARSESIKTVTAKQAYRRIKKVIALQWRGTAIVLIIVINVVYLAVVFVHMDNSVAAALQDLERAKPWLLCLAITEGNKSACLDKVKEAQLVTSEPKVMAVLLLLSLNGIWALIFLGRTSMVVGWRDLIKRCSTRPTTDFVSADAKRFSGDPKQYEMIVSPPSQSYSMPKKEFGPVTTSAPVRDRGLSPLPQSPLSHYKDDCFGEEVRFDKVAHPYLKSKLSFSTPRPPRAGQKMSRGFSQGDQAINRSFSPQSNATGRPSSPLRTASRTGAYSPPIEWNPTSTHAKPSR